MIKINNFSKSYESLKNKDSFCVENINLEVTKQNICALLGPNGSGKTTIMKAICGFHYPTFGEILIDNNDGAFINVSENPDLAKKMIGYVPEKSILPPDMSVYDFLVYCKSLHQNCLSIKEVVEECSLEKVLTKKIKTLSKGYCQRVSFAQAIIHNPANLILDEPVSGLDPAQIIQMRSLIQKLSKTKTILLSTHLLQEVYSLCNQICIISNGKITACGDENSILKQSKSQNLEQAFMKLTIQSE